MLADKQETRSRNATLKEVSPTAYTFIGEISIDGGPSTKIEQGKATKK
jgi:hypothetical protein